MVQPSEAAVANGTIDEKPEPQQEEEAKINEETECLPELQNGPPDIRENSFGVFEEAECAIESERCDRVYWTRILSDSEICFLAI